MKFTSICCAPVGPDARRIVSLPWESGLATVSWSEKSMRLRIAECISPLFPTSLRAIQRDNRCDFTAVRTTVDWLNQRGIGVYLMDNYVIVPKADRDLLVLICEEHRRAEHHRRLRRSRSPRRA